MVLALLANNLYGTSQLFKMPQSKFRWLSRKEISRINWSTVDADNDLGYFVECSLHYPIEIREHTKDFPLCAENKIITYDMLSEYQKNFLKRAYGKSCYSQKKLTATFLDRNKMYVKLNRILQYIKRCQVFFFLKLILNQI